MAFKEEILQLAFNRAQKAADVLEAAQELFHAGRLTVHDFLQIQADLQAGYAFKAAESLERLLAVELIKRRIEAPRSSQVMQNSQTNGGQMS